MIHLSGYVVQQLLLETVHSLVYRAASKADRRPVVIKLARQSSAEVHAAAQQELEIIRKLDGLAVVRAIELDYFEDHPALVMELFPGTGMDHWLAGRALGLAEFLQLALAITHTVAGIHDRGVIHRDLKPANLLINPDSFEICVADFGVAASLDGALSLQAAAMVGSLAYLSPEQTGRMNRKVDSRSDLYSLGATFYELCTGKLPFDLASGLELVHAHAAITPRSASELVAGLPEVVSALISKLLAKNPDDRYQSAHGVEADLQTLMARHAAGQPLGELALGARDRARTFLLPTKLYGRTAEIAVIEDCLAAAHGGAARLLAVGGASGSGKSALFAEAEHRTSLSRGYFIKGKFDRLATNVPFSAVSHALTDLVDQLLAKTDRELDAIRSVLRGRLAGLGQVILEIAPAVEKLLGPQPAVPQLGLRESQARIGDVFWRFISALATRERPLVMVLDDLQWADSGSLLLVETLLGEACHGRDKAALLLLCGYRDNELSASHPVRQLLDRQRPIDDGGAPDPAIRELTLAPLDAGHLAELLGDMLRLPRDAVGALAETVLRKTSGNAFFVHQFLRHAHRLGLFRFVPDEGWRWDLAAIEAAGIPDDAAGLMADKLNALTASVRGVVVDASVIGDEFDLTTLFAVTGATRDHALHAIHALINDGLIVRAGAAYRFAHDRIRDAALGLCPADHAAAVHVEVGRHRLRALGPAASGVQLFAITDHLNHGHARLSAGERIEVAQLNLKAGKQALAVGAVPTAERYFEAGIQLLDGGASWRDHFQLVFDLTLEHAHARFFNGAAEPALAALHGLFERELSLPNTAAVYLRLISAWQHRQDYARASREGLTALTRVGIQLPTQLTGWRRKLAMAKMARKIGARPERFLELPESTDEVARARHQLTNTLSYSLYSTDVMASAILAMKAVAAMTEDGVDACSPLELAGYAQLLQSGLHNPALALRFADVANELHQRIGSPRDTPTMMFRQYQMLRPWHVPYRESLDAFGTAIEKAFDVGDRFNVMVCHACRLICALTEGIHLARVERFLREADDASVRIRRLSDIPALGSLHVILDQLRNQPVLELPADWRTTPQLRRHDIRLTSFHHAASAQLLVLLVRADWDAAFGLAELVWPYIFRVARGSVWVWLACVGVGLGAAIRLPGAARAERRRYRKRLDDAIAMLRKWAVHNPAFFGHKAAWIEAEHARARGRTERAMTLYLQAREGALAGQYPHIAAMIDLRRGELALEIGLTSEAGLRFQAAIAALRAWGARAVVSQLEQRFATHVLVPEAVQIAKGPASLESNLATGITDAQSLDFKALINASQAIAQEVTLASVLERVMASAMASAGATLGVLVLEKAGALTIELRQRAGGKLERCGTPISDDDDLPHAIIHYVQRSGEPVVLGDAAGKGRFTGDPWVVSRAAKSILCAPIVKHARRVGVLMLHNDLVSDAFIARHLTTLQMLATQAAISIDNAILYDELSALNRELEARVDDRTAALHKAHQQLIESARKAGMADVAIEVLHNVGNSLNSVNVSAQLIHTRLGDSKVKTVVRLVELLDRHKANLDEFFRGDPRGQKIVAMLPSLGALLTAEQDATVQELLRLRANLENIGAVVRELEVTADHRDIAILEAPHVLLGEATAAISARSQREQITVVTDCHDLGGARVDKHKGRDILAGLLANAIDAFDTTAVEHKLIRISLRGGPDAVVFQISDNGAGIASEQLTQIFHDQFGNRLGANLHKLANAASSAGGSLTAASDGPGRGATFTLVLPDRGARPSRQLPRLTGPGVTGAGAPSSAPPSTGRDDALLRRTDHSPPAS